MRPNNYEDFYKKWKRKHLQELVIGFVGSVSVLVFLQSWYKLFGIVFLLFFVSGIINYRDICKWEVDYYASNKLGGKNDIRK